MVWRRRYDEDEVDRVNRLWTVVILGIAGVAAVTYVAVFPDEAISCQPTEIGVGSSLYANRYCLGRARLGSYDWVYGHDLVSYHGIMPVFLFIQVLAFLFPHVLAHFLGGIFGNETEFLFKCAEYSKSDRHHDGSPVMDRIKSPPKPSNIMTILFLVKKALVLLNSFIQLVMIGLVARPDLYNDTTRAFPLTAYCITESTKYKCGFNVNSIFRRFYLCFFYWLLALTLMNIGCLVAWILKLFLPRLTSKTLSRYTMNASSGEEEKTQRFLKEHIGRDYLLSLLIAQSTEREITAADLTLKYWQSYEPSVVDTGANGNNVPMNQM